MPNTEPRKVWVKTLDEEIEDRRALIEELQGEIEEFEEELEQEDEEDFELADDTDEDEAA